MKRLGLAMLFLCATAAAEDPYYRAPEKWVEGETTLPAFPKQENLLEAYVSAATSNHFFIDGSSLRVGTDGVVRYVLVVKTAGGATNISFEGMRCSSVEYKLYATGRSDGTWGKARAEDWLRIENKAVNRHHAALYSDYFCPDRTPIANPEEGREALRLGKNRRAL